MTRLWTNEEIEFLKSNYKDLTTANLIVALGRSAQSIKCKAHKLSLTERIGKRINAGDKFGRLLTLERQGTASSGHPIWICLCECGVIKGIEASRLKLGTTSSCGCFRSEQTSKRLKHEESDKLVVGLLTGIGSFRSRYGGSLTGAKKRGYSWELTFEEYITIVRENCVYCGSEPKPYSRNLNRKGIRRKGVTDEGLLRSTIYVNGIDRVDNNVGYTLSNSATCCKTCNLAKNTMSVAEFAAWLASLVKFQLGTQE